MNRANDDQSYPGANRVRHVPIYVESSNHTLDSRPGNVSQSNMADPRKPNYADNQHNQYFQHNYTQNQSSAPNLGPKPRFNSKQEHQQNPYPDSSGQDTSYVDISYQPHGKSQDQKIQRSPKDNHKGSDMHEQTEPRRSGRDNHQGSSQSRFNESNPNKENDISSSNESAYKDETKGDPGEMTDSSERAITPTVIPLPPPPDQGNKYSSDQAGSKEATNGNSSKTAETPTESKKPKKESGPLAVILDIKDEVNRLLQEIGRCNETSIKSKGYLRLEELLTRCILRLDDIECAESQNLRQQRKAVIEFIDKCTDILQRKVQLNFDIQQLTSKTV